MMTEAAQTFSSVLWRYAGTWLCCILVLWYGLQPGLGMFGSAVIMGILLCSPFVLHTVVKYRARRLASLVRFGSWCSVAVALFVYHTLLAHRMEKDAAEISARIEAYASQHDGAYPKQIELVGVFAASRMLFYDDGSDLHSPDKADIHPLLFYRSTWDMFDRYFYDFRTHRWEFYPD